MIKVGDIFPSNNHGEVSVIDYVDINQVTIRFSCGTEKVVVAGNLRKGEVSPRVIAKRKVKGFYDYKDLREEYKNYKILSHSKHAIEFNCSKCNKDIYSVLYPEGKIFVSKVSCFQEGKVPCRCYPYFRKTEEEWGVLFNHHMKDKGTFLRTVVTVDNVKCWDWVCKNGHTVTTRIGDNTYHKSGCPECCSRCKDTLYLIKLTKEDGRSYTKVGITKNLDYRMKMYSDEGLYVSDLQYFNTNVIGVTNAMDLERKILKLCRKYKLTTPDLKGYTGYTEVLPEHCYNELLSIFNTLQKEGDFTEYEIKDFLMTGGNK